MHQEGSLQILRLEEDPDSRQQRYSVAFAPYNRRGGALPSHVSRSDPELPGHRADQRFGEADIVQLLADVRRSGRASVPNVALSRDQLKKYGLQEMGILQSVISYLST
jgi:hypothetical protein